MAKWKINGKVVDEEDVPYYLDAYEFDFLKDEFEEQFNRRNSAASVLFDYVGEDAYHDEFRDWLRTRVKFDPTYLENIDGVSRVSASVRTKSASCASKTKSKAPSKKAPAKKSAPRRR